MTNKTTTSNKLTELSREELARLADDLKRTIDCYHAARVTWPEHVLAAIRAGDVEACAADAKARHANWTELHAKLADAEAPLYACGCCGHTGRDFALITHAAGDHDLECPACKAENIDEVGAVLSELLLKYDSADAERDALRIERDELQAKLNGADQRANAAIRERDEARAEVERLGASVTYWQKARQELLVERTEPAEAERDLANAQAQDFARQREECAAEAVRLRALLKRVQSLTDDVDQGPRAATGDGEWRIPWSLFCVEVFSDVAAALAQPSRASEVLAERDERLAREASQQAWRLATTEVVTGNFITSSDEFRHALNKRDERLRAKHCDALLATLADDSVEKPDWLAKPLATRDARLVEPLRARNSRLVELLEANGIKP